MTAYREKIQAQLTDKIINLGIMWLGILIAWMLYLHSGVVFRPNGFIFNFPLTEDGYYSLAVARNFAQGNGITIDGERFTNGFQPLFTLLESFCFWLAGEGNDDLAIRFVLILSWIVMISTACMVGVNTVRLMHHKIESKNKKILNFMLGLTLYLGTFLTFEQHFNGLETGFLLFMFNLLWYLHQKYLVSAKGRLLIGIVLGLLVLTRIDTIIFVVIYFTAIYVTSPQIGGFQKNDFFMRRMIKLMPMGILAVLISLPWFLYNLFYFGKFMPSSGTAQMSIQLDFNRLIYAAKALLAGLMPGLFGLNPTFAGLTPSIIASTVILISGLLFGLYKYISWINRTRNIKEIIKNATKYDFIVMLAVYLGLIICLYIILFYAYWFYIRYFFVLSIIGITLTAFVLSHYWRNYNPLCVLIGLSVMIYFSSGQVNKLLMRPSNGYPGAPYMNQVKLVTDTVPSGEIVAALQTGTLNFFVKNTLNLDGKVNAEALKYSADLPNYLTRMKANWLCDFGGNIKTILGQDATNSNWYLAATSKDKIFECWHRKP